MTTPPTVHRLSSTAYLNTTVEHLDEFIIVIDSLGRKWNPLLHPRDRNGRFIRTFSFVTFDLPGGTTTPGGQGGSVSGRVVGIDKDGNLLVKVRGVGPGAPPNVKVDNYVKVPHDQVEVRTIKAQLAGRGAAGRLNGQEARSVTRGAAVLRNLGLGDQANKLDEALRLSNQPVDPRNPAASQAAKDQAIALMRDVGEALGAERGKGFDPGTDYEEIKGTLTPAERARLQSLDQVIGTTFTARHSLGDKTIDAQNDEGPIKAKKAEVRLQAAEQELSQDYASNATVWDATSGTLVESHLEQPVKAEVRDTVSEQQGQQVLPGLARSTYQKLQTGLSRLSGWKQAQQVAPSDRFHVDKNGDETVVGHIVTVDPTKSRAGFTGMVTRIYTDTNGGKHVYARDFDPGGSKGYPKGYKDYSVQGGSIQLADEGEQSAVFQQLAQLGAGDASKALVKSFTNDYLEQMRRRYASPDAKRISPTGGFFDVAPIHNRVRADSNGEAIRIGDHVMGPNGESGVVTYIEPNENTVKVQYPNGQQAARVSSKRLTRLHGPSSDVYLRESQYGDNNYVPTREEAAAIADQMGATSVADAIRGGGDASAIQQAMNTDAAFQGALPDAQALFDRRDDTLSSGQELPAEDRQALGNWDRLAAASAGQFREGDAPPTVPTAPAPETPGERPGNPANPDETVSEGGITVRADGDNVVVNDNVEQPIPATDQQAVDDAVNQAEGQQQAPQEPPVPQSVANRIASDLKQYASELDYKDNVQRLQVQKHLGGVDDALKAGDGDAFVNALRGLTNATNSNVNKNLRGSKLHQVLNGAASDGTPLHEFIRSRIDAGNDIFNAPQAVQQVSRPEQPPSDVPEGVDPKVDQVDNAVSEALLMDDGSTLVMQGDQPVDEGFYVVDQATVTEFDHEPTTTDITGFLNETQGSNYDGVSIWFNEDDGRYRMARVGVFDNEQQAGEAAANSGANQYVNIADGLVYNVALGGDPNGPVEAIEDPRSEERAVRVAGTGRSSAKATAKQKAMLDHVAGVAGADPEIGRISEAVKNGGEISGADASRLADHIDGLDASQFDKPSDKGVASQLAHRLARAAGEEGARGYSSQNTALRRSSDVDIALTSALDTPDELRSLVEAARTDVKNGDFGPAAEKFRQAADAYDALGRPNDAASRRAREHADRLAAMGGVTVPAPAAQGQQPTAQDALNQAGLPDTVPITKQSLSNPDTPRTRQVSPQEFAALALAGKNTLDGFNANAAEPTIAQPQVLTEVKTNAWDAVQTDWGGLTVDAHAAQIVEPDTGFAMTIRPTGVDTVSVPIGASQADFESAMDEAIRRFGSVGGPLWMEHAHLGVFRNEDTGNIEIDPVLLVDNVGDVESIGAYTHSVGGAYSFADGNGYWPPHVAEGAPGGGAEGLPQGASPVAGPGPQGGEAVPGVGPPQEAGPAGVGPQAPALAQQPISPQEAISGAESAVESEALAEGDRGPQGMTPELQDIQAKIDVIRNRTDDSTLADDLRALAKDIEDNFRLTDGAAVAAEIREGADNVVPATPGAGETPAAVPF